MFGFFRRQEFGFAWLLLIFGVIVSALSLVSRARHDAAPDAVEIALEWKESTRLADASQIPLERWLTMMRDNGARGAIVDVESVRELSEEGRLSLLGRAQSAPLWPAVARLPRSYRYVIACGDVALSKRVTNALLAQKMVNPPRPIAPGVVAVALSNGALSSWPVGLDTRTLATLRHARVEPIARLSDWQGVTPARLNGLFRQLRADGARILIVGAGSASVSAPGDKTLLPITADLLRRNSLSLAWIEGDATRGSGDLARASQGFLVRAHAVSAADSLALEPESLVERYARAARERNVRLLLVRMPRGLRGEPDPSRPLSAQLRWKRGAFAQQQSFIESLADEIKRNHWQFAARPTLTIGLAQKWGVGARGALKATLARAGAGLAVVGAALLVLGLFAPLSARQRFCFALIGIVGAGALAFSPGAGAQILALCGAIIFPVWALAWSGLGARRKLKSRREAVFAATRVLARATLLSLAGGIVIAALLNSWTYQTKAADFAGTKAASVLPVALVFLLLLGEFWPGANIKRGWQRVARRARVIGGRAFSWRDVILAALSIAIVGLWLARSGNDSGVAVSTWEWKFRALLETLFVARPRTKEFLLCNPALIVGALCAFARCRSSAFPLILLGTIGQVSVLNSFAQANNPLYIPLWRTLLSLGLGAAFGGFLAWPGAIILGFARDTKRWRGWLKLRRLTLATGAGALLIWGSRRLILGRRYDELTAPSQNTNWPWTNAKRETLRAGVTHFASQLDDGTTLDLLAFDFRANPRLRFGLWDADLNSSPNPNRPDNRFAYWNNGLASQAAALNQNGDLVACWNGGFFGLLNRKPRASDRAFHLSPIVENGIAHYEGVNHRWTWGAKSRDGQPQFKIEHQPKFAGLTRDFDAATGTLQALMIDGKPLELRPYPWFGVLPQKPPIASTPREAGHIPTLDWMHTARLSAGWNARGKLWILIVKEPDGEAASRAAFNRRERGRGGWTLADAQRFWLAMHEKAGVQSAVGLDGGDVAQAAWRRPDDKFEVLAPRIALPATQDATKRLTTDAKFQNARDLRGGALTYFWVREEK